MSDECGWEPTASEREYVAQRESDPVFRAWDDALIAAHCAERDAERIRLGTLP